MWYEQQVSLYSTHNDNIGTIATLREILFCDFARDLDTIIDLRRLDHEVPDYKARKKALKDTIQGYTPASLLTARGLTEEEKKQGMTIQSKVVHLTGITSIDFDQLEQYDINEVKRAIGALPFVCYCGLSASGAGLFALVLIAEPERQREYVEHIFEVFKYYGIPPDTTKGRNVNDLRYVSYDSNPVINDNPEPLRIAIKPKKKPLPQKQLVTYQNGEGKKIKALNNAVSDISNAQVGQRWGIVQHWAYALGGFREAGLLGVLQDAIKANTAFTGEEQKYCKCAADCFSAGALKPWT
jgi:hypothetical protein